MNKCGNCEYWKPISPVLGKCYGPVPIAVEIPLKRETSGTEGYDCESFKQKDH